MNFKVHQTCTGTKKNKKTQNFTIYLGRGDYPSKVFVFFVCFCPCTGLVHFKTFAFLSLCRFDALWSSKLLFFVPVQVWCTLKFKTQCIRSFVFWYCWCCLQIFFTHMAFFASHAAFWRIRCIFHAKGLQFEEKNDLFQNQILFSGYCFLVLKCQYISCHMYSGCNFHWYLQCFWTCDHIDYLVVSKSLNRPLGGGWPQRSSKWVKCIESKSATRNGLRHLLAHQQQDHRLHPKLNIKNHQGNHLQQICAQSQRGKVIWTIENSLFRMELWFHSLGLWNIQPSTSTELMPPFCQQEEGLESTEC